jgi:8-amino-7-oxononanoate synthase
MRYSDLESRLLAAKESGRFKSLPKGTAGPDFQSNDVLGLAQNTDLKEYLLGRMVQENLPLGAGASRSISGNLELYAQCENALAHRTGVQAALLTASAFQANALFFSTVPARTDRIVYDKSVHASMRLAIHHSRVPSIGFTHGDWQMLEQILNRPHAGNTYLAIESVYSMSGDVSPLNLIRALHLRYGFRLVVDEAHSIGAMGNNGEGWACTDDRQSWIFASIVGFGKALGSAGGAVLGPKTLIDLLSGTGKAFIYSTGIQPLSALQVSTLMQEPHWIQQGQSKLESNLKCLGTPTQPDKAGWIRFYITKPKPEWEHQFGLKYLSPPTVELGAEGYRCMVHAHNTPAEMNTLKTLLIS